MKLTRKQPEAQGPQWAEVARFGGYDADMQGDLAVCLLEGSGIPAIRIPPQVSSMVFDGFGAPLFLVKIFVPPDRAQDARELLESDNNDSDTPPEAEA